MEDNIQTIIVVIISAFLLFIFPVYVAYEKKDDISYALAMRYTQDLVDEVRSKGYLTKNMYEDYRAKLKVTGNTYDIQMTHEYNRYDPITNYYKLEDGKYILVKTTTQEQREKFEQEKLEELPDTANDIAKQEHLKNAYNDLGIAKVEDTYKLSKETYTKDHIVAVLNSERKLKLNSSFDEVVSCPDEEEDDSCQYAYIMNVDDNFNVTIKNTNITLATVIYNMVTANTLDSNTRIYVNYGGAILSNKWQGNIDYSKMDHDNISLNKFKETIIFSKERVFKINAHPEEAIPEDYNGQYVLDFDVKPNAVTDLREKGPLRVADYTKYNFAAGNNVVHNKDSVLSVSVGLNGVSLIASNVQNQNVTTVEPLVLPTYQRAVEKTRVVQEEYVYIYEDKEMTGVRDKIETYIEYEVEQRKIEDYSKVKITHNEDKLEVNLTGKSGVDNYTAYIQIQDVYNLLNGFEWEFNNPQSNVYSGTLGSATNNRGTKVSYSVNITDTTIGITANKKVSEEMTILSYPVTINEYANIRIEWQETEATKKLEADKKKYIALLYIDNEKVDESIELDVIPKVTVVGKTIIGNEERFFTGSIKNAKIYALATN